MTQLPFFVAKFRKWIHQIWKDRISPRVFTHTALALSAKMAKEKTFDQEIHQEIIPSFAPESKSDVHGLILTYIHCLNCTVQARWFGVHSSECDFFMTMEDNYHNA